MTSSHQEESTSGGGGSSHPGTSGRSPPPGTGVVGGRPSIGASGTAGRPSIGSSITSGIGGAASSAAAAGGGRPPSLDSSHPGRLSYGSTALHGTRLSYGGSGGITPTNNLSSVMSPPSTASTNNTGTIQQSQFFAALSPATSKYLRGGATGLAGGASASASASVSGGLQSPASKAAANAMRTAANAARGIDDAGDELSMNEEVGDGANGLGNDDNNQQQEQRQHQSQNQPSNTPAAQTIGQDNETAQLRSFVQSLLGMHLPASTTTTTNPLIPMMTTPDPATAAFYATSLLTKTATSSNGTVTSWRPDDAYLAARALSLKGEHKRAIWMLDKVGLIGFGLGGDAGGGGVEQGEFDQDEFGNEADGSADYGGNGNGNIDENNMHAGPAVSNEQGIRNALLLRAESALLAGQCLNQAGEYERAITVYEEAMRFPPPPPPPEWGMHGYGYRLDNGLNGNNAMNNLDEDEEGGLDAKLHDPMYIRSWREQSLSHTALIDDGDDERLLQFAMNIQQLPFQEHNGTNSTTEGIHPLARLCCARGIAYDQLSNPHRAVPFLRMALTIDSRCVEAWDYVVKRRLLTPEEERQWIGSLNFGDGNQLIGMGMPWLRDAYLSRLRGGAGGIKLPPTALKQELADKGGAGARDNTIIGASPVPRSDLQSPSMLSLGSPDFAGGSTGVKDKGQAPDIFSNAPAAENEHSPPISQSVDQAFLSLATAHNLGLSPSTLSCAAIRSYSAHDLQSALTYCTVLDSVDPYCSAAGYVHVATLVGLGLKRRLFQLAHRLVDTDPKDALAWFAVGSYYYSCGRYDLAQRHFSRSTRLDPGSAECWIGFGCSFAVCDESDQALASFRAAQNKYSGSHVPLLYMGMEYLRTNHLSLAGHFLNSAQRVDPSDVLCCNELGVWSYRQGGMEDASFWFVKALRLHVRAAEGGTLNCVDEGLGMNGYVLLNGKVVNENGGKGSRAYNEDAAAASNAATTTPYTKRTSSNDAQPPISTILFAVKTPSGQSIAASIFSSDIDNGVVHDGSDGVGSMTDAECIERIKDTFWEPSIFNLGQSYRKMKRYKEAIVCFEKCCSLNPGNYAAYAALGFAKHLSGDVDGAIDSYHEALSRKPEDPFTSEMLTRALSEAVTYPPSLAMLSSFPHETEDHRSGGGIGSSILKKMDKRSSCGNANNPFDAPPHTGGGNEQDESMFTSNSNDVDMSFA